MTKNNLILRGDITHILYTYYSQYLASCDFGLFSIIKNNIKNCFPNDTEIIKKSNNK